MHDYESEMLYLEQNRKDVYDKVRHQHLANKVFRAKEGNKPKSNMGLFYILSRLYRIRIHISFDLEDPSPKPKVTS